MSKVLIENYRGFDIMFDTDDQKFDCVVNEENSKQSGSYAAMKSFIDDYKKTNQHFEPFWVETVPKRHSDKMVRFEIIGIRKDGRFIYRDNKGQTQQLSDYNTSDYMLVKPENEDAISRLVKLKADILKRSIEDDRKIVAIIDTLDIVTVKEYKRSIM